MVAPAPILHRYRGAALAQQGRRVAELLRERPQWSHTSHHCLRGTVRARHSLLYALICKLGEVGSESTKPSAPSTGASSQPIRLTDLVP
jgi:hypothetical protein